MHIYMESRKMELVKLFAGQQRRQRPHLAFKNSKIKLL